MYNNGRNKKGLFLLILLSSFSYWCVKNIQSPTTEIKAEENPELCNQINATEVFNDETADLFYEMTNNGIREVVPTMVVEQDVNGEVLNASAGSLCKQAGKIFENEEACNLQQSGGVNYEERNGGSREGTMVSKNSTVELVEVVAPIYLLAGSFETKDSNWKLTNENPVYKPAGEYYADEDVFMHAPPGDKETRGLVAGASKMEPYSTKYSVGYAENNTVSDEGEAVVQKTATTNCPECQKPPNDNPDKSNRMANYLESIFMRYPGEIEDNDWSNELPFGQECENLDYIVVEQEDGETCEKRWGEIIWTKITSIFSSSKWNACNSPSTDSDGNVIYDDNGNPVYGEECISSESIFVKMNPIFTETSSYTQRRNKTVKSPVAAEQYENKFFVTNCQAKVDGKIVGVKCAWDLGPMLDELDFAQYDDVGESETPSEEAYIKYLQDESSTREDPLVEL